MLCMFRNWISGCSQQDQSCNRGPVPYSDVHLVFLHFSSPGSGSLGLDYSLHPQILKNDDFCLSVSGKGHDLLMNSLMSSASLKDENLKTCRAPGIQTKLCDVLFPMPEFLFKRLHTENVQWRRLAQGFLRCLKFAVSFLVAWKWCRHLIWFLTLVYYTQRGIFRKQGSICWRPVKPILEHVPTEFVGALYSSSSVILSEKTRLGRDSANY